MPVQLERLAAQRRIYGDAQRLVAAQWLLATVPALCWAILLSHIPTAKVYATFTALIVTFIDFGLLDPWIKKLRTMGAQVQESFDTETLELGWNSLRSGKQPPPELIQQYAKRAGTSEERDKAFMDWYPRAVGELPIENARLLCQRTNCQWDATLRRRYAWLDIVALMAIAIAVAILGLVRNPTFNDIVLIVVAPISPIVLLLLRQGRDFFAFAEVSEHLREHIETVWSASLKGKWTVQRLKNEATAIQSEIFLRRATAPMVFDCVYKRLKTASEENAQQAAQKYVDQAKRLMKVGEVEAE